MGGRDERTVPRVREVLTTIAGAGWPAAHRFSGVQPA